MLSDYTILHGLINGAIFTGYIFLLMITLSARLLYALVEAEVLEMEGEKYSNTPESSHYLVKGKPARAIKIVVSSFGFSPTLEL